MSVLSPLLRFKNTSSVRGVKGKVYHSFGGERCGDGGVIGSIAVAAVVAVVRHPPFTEVHLARLVSSNMFSPPRQMRQHKNELRKTAIENLKDGERQLQCGIRETSNSALVRVGCSVAKRAATAAAAVVQRLVTLNTGGGKAGGKQGGSTAKDGGAAAAKNGGTANAKAGGVAAAPKSVGKQSAAAGKANAPAGGTARRGERKKAGGAAAEGTSKAGAGGKQGTDAAAWRCCSKG
ncbi:hypothetical protein DFJ73DRAFT_757132 [Zopfochytrium polystomum]|nr:hypothetical protein DFJ73DRAFT_757132 [Zopfochytrium polystomum]